MAALLDAGAKINEKNKVWVTALHWACASGHEDTVELLIGRDADIGARDKLYQTPMHAAASNGARVPLRPDNSGWGGGHRGFF